MSDDPTTPIGQAPEDDLSAPEELRARRRLPRAAVLAMIGLVMAAVLAVAVVTLAIQRGTADVPASAPSQQGTAQGPTPEASASPSPTPRLWPTPSPPVADPAPVAHAPADPVEPVAPAQPAPDQPAPAIPPIIPAPDLKPTVVVFTASNLFGIAYVCANQKTTPRTIPVNIRWRTSPGTIDSVQVTASNPYSLPTVAYNQPANYSMNYQIDCDQTTTVLLKFRNVSDQVTARLTITGGGDQGWVYQ